MNIQKIKGEIGKGLAGIVLASGLISGVSGCGTLADAYIADMTQLGIETAIVSGIRTSIEGPRGTTVNVYNGSQQQTQVAQKPMNTTKMMKHFFINQVEGPFSCNSWIDNNNNGEIEPAELYGVEKEEFRKMEPILVGCAFYHRKGEVITRKVYDNQGNLIDKGEIVCPRNNCIYYKVYENLDPGMYKIAWSIGDKFFKNIDIRVTD